ncbi:MAG: GtrA family protein [Alistipes sp.]
MIKDKKKWKEFFRFCIVGTLAAGIHYGVYYLLQHWMNVNVAYTLGYMVALVCNFFLTAYFTFHSAPSFKKVFGFGGSHLVNYFLHMVLFNLFLLLGASREIAPILVLTIAVPINFLLVRWVFRRR